MENTALHSPAEAPFGNLSTLTKPKERREDFTCTLTDRATTSRRTFSESNIVKPP
jgi:hypothetical protein